MIGHVVDMARQSALRRVFAAFRAETSAETVKAYKDGLADVPDALLVAAIDEAIKGEAFFPSVARIRTYCDAVKPAIPDRPTLPAVAPSVYLTGNVAPMDEEDPRLWVHCTNCKDSGWMEEMRMVTPKHTMPVAVGNKGVIERRVIPPHEKSYFSPCHCRATNPKLVQERQRNARYGREVKAKK